MPHAPFAVGLGSGSSGVAAITDWKAGSRSNLVASDWPELPADRDTFGMKRF
jgi:hypothetical protein